MTTETLDSSPNASSPGKRPFLRVTEIWVPSKNRSELELYDGIYGELEEFREHSSSVRFPYGEGLPGQAWQNRCPIVLNDFEGTYFKRTKEAHDAGLTSAIALPIFSGEFLRAVIVFLCGDSEALSGAIEIWKLNDVDSLDFKDGYYGDLDRFEHLSKSIQFPRGHGLPGTTLVNRLPTLMEKLSGSSSFLRARYAAEAGIRTGIALPFFEAESFDTVVTFLSSKSTPIARRFEIWLPSPDRSHLFFGAGIDGDTEHVTTADLTKTIKHGEGPIGKCWLKGIPEVIIQPPGSEYDSLLTIPIIDGALLNSVIVCFQ
ncbi:MAG: GAF domain-containing protein [Verrucomicrobiales bacterium]|nr:GAF domain-containing protein [Verrucomicrobiales bacterium]